MGEKMTTMHLRGTDFGLAEWGHKSVHEMVAVARIYAEHLRRQAEAVEAAADADFTIYTHTGVHVQRNVVVIQEGRPAQSLTQEAA